MTSRGRYRRRGGALFEVMLSIAIFAGAGAFALGSMRSMLAGLDRSHRQQQAVDLARSKMAELHAGLISLADLEAEYMMGVGTFEHFNEEPGLQPLWTVQTQTERTEHGDLVVVALTVAEDPANADPVRYTLRQLVRVREVQQEEQYEADDLLEGL